MNDDERITSSLQPPQMAHDLIRTLPGYCLLMMAPMTKSFHLHLGKMCRENMRIFQDESYANKMEMTYLKLGQKHWQMTARTDLIWWKPDSTIYPPRSRKRHKPDSVILFFVAGFHGGYLYGHSMKNVVNARKREPEFSLKRDFIPMAAPKRTPDWISSLPRHIKNMLKPKARVERILIADLTEYFMFCEPFPLIPCLYEKKETIKGTYAFGIPTWIIAVLRRKFGWQFVFQVFKC